MTTVETCFYLFGKFIILSCIRLDDSFSYVFIYLCLARNEVKCIECRDNLTINSQGSYADIASVGSV